jgi:hypothetical protein
LLPTVNVAILLPDFTSIVKSPINRCENRTCLEDGEARRIV